MTVVDIARASAAYEHYIRVREWARRMAALDGEAKARRTDAERSTADSLAPLWNATPEMMAGLRRWCRFAGEAAADDQDPESGAAKAIRRDLKRLFVQVGRDLFVAESPILGGFGCRTSAGLCNADTVRFFGALVALEDGAVLAHCRQQSRRLVWEIGGGWGGFAYQFKTICPNVTYVITGSPETFLLSAVYVMTAFPDARCRFYGESAADGVWDRWEDVDFIFAPEAALHGAPPPRLDLTLDLLALQQMTPERIEQHVRRACESGCRYLYSLHRGDWAAGEIPAVWRAIERLYWIHPVPPRVELQKSGVAYSHLIGWRRMRT